MSKRHSKGNRTKTAAHGANHAAMRADASSVQASAGKDDTPTPIAREDHETQALRLQPREPVREHLRPRTIEHRRHDRLPLSPDFVARHQKDSCHE